MGKDDFNDIVNCDRCGEEFEIGPWSRERNYCTICSIELEMLPDPDWGIVVLAGPLPGDWQEEEQILPCEAEFDFPVYFMEDRAWNMDELGLINKAANQVC